MKVLFRVAALVALVFGWMPLRASAQGVDIGATNNIFFAMYGPTNAALNSAVTYSIYITNTSGIIIQAATVTNTLPDNVILTDTQTSLGTFFSYRNTVVFQFAQLPGVGLVQMSVTVRPRATGTFVNSAVLSTLQLTNQLSASITTVVSNTTVADLGLTLSAPTQAIITNDYFNVNVTVTNAGPSDATNVQLTNSLPAGMYYVGITPSKISVNRSGSNVVAQLGTIPAGGLTNVAVRVASTNAGTSVFLATVYARDNIENSNTNNTASTNLVIQTYGPASLTVTNTTTQVFDPQTGEMEQYVVVQNTGLLPAASVRVLVSGLGTNRFYNALGTNGGNGYVVHAAPLAGGDSVTLLLQYYVPTHRTVDVAFQAYEVPVYDTSVSTAPSSPIGDVRIFPLTSGVLSNSMYLDFPSVSNRTYTVVYSDDPGFANARTALPPATSAANFTEWIDFGPPVTITHPTNATSRFYRVYLNPQ